MFHFADPEDAGSGVTILMPGLIRSSQPVMCFGLPFFTTITTTESLTMPLVAPLFQSAATNFGTSLVMSEPTEKLTRSAGWPPATALLCDPLGPNDSENLTPLPLSVATKAVSSAS